MHIFCQSHDVQPPRSLLNILSNTTRLTSFRAPLGRRDSSDLALPASPHARLDRTLVACITCVHALVTIYPISWNEMCMGGEGKRASESVAQPTCIRLDSFKTEKLRKHGAAIQP